MSEPWNIAKQSTQRIRKTPSGEASPEVRIHIANFLHKRPNYYRNNCNVERILSSLLGRLLYKNPQGHLNPPLINPLQKLGKGTEDSGEADNGDVGTVHEGGTGAGAGRAAGAGAGGAGATVGSGGVVVGGIALEATLDDVVALQLAEVAAAEVAAGALHVEATLDILKSTERKPIRYQYLGWKKPWEQGRLLVEGTAEVNGTVDTLEGRQTDGGELIITGNGESTVNSLQDGHADVGQLGVVLEDQVTGLGQVGSGEGLELGTPEAELTGELLERRQGDGGDVLEGHVGTGAQVREVDLEGVVVTREADQIGGVHQVVDVDGLQITVVLDAEGTDSLKGDTVQVSQTSVSDANIASLSDTLGEGQRLELRESLPVNGTNGVELSEIKEGQGGETLQVEGLSDRGKRGSSDGADVSTTRANQTTGDLLDTTDREVAAVGLVNGDITLHGGAGVDPISIALGLDLGIAAGCGIALLVGV